MRLLDGVLGNATSIDRCEATHDSGGDKCADDELTLAGHKGHADHRRMEY